MALAYFGIDKVLCFLPLVLVIVWCWYQWKNRKILHFARKLPTVKSAWPLVGHLIQCKFRHVLDLREMISYFLLDLSCYASQRNINHYCLWFGPKPYITITNPQDIKVVLSRNLEKGEEFDLLKYAVGNGLITGPVNIWKPTRKAILPLFQRRNLKRVTPILNAKSKILVKELSKFIGEIDCEVQSNTLKSSVSTTLDFLYGSEIKLSERTAVELNLIKAVQTWFYLWTERSLSLFSRWDSLFHVIYKKSISEVKEQAKFIMDHAKKVLPEKVANAKDGESLKSILNNGGRFKLSDVFAPFMAKNESVTCEDFYNNACTMLTAGAKTTSFTLSTCLLLLAIHQDIQEKTYEEIISIVGSSNEDIDFVNITKLTYVDQVIKETMRIFPVIPVFSRILMEDTTLSFGTAPAGSHISINVYGVHTDPKNYLDPLKFDPDRFSPENVSKRHKFSFLSFGGGPRNCIGGDYAALVIKVALVHILREYKITTTFQMKDIKFVYQIELQHKNGCKVAISKRS